MKTPALLSAVLAFTIVVVATGFAAPSPHEIFLLAKQTATDANFRNDQAGLRAALAFAVADKIADSTLTDWGRTLAEGWLANLCLTANPPRPDEARALAAEALRQRPDFWYVTTQIVPKLPQP